MPHEKSLRAIGQSLESFGVVAFVMEKDGRSYIVRSDSLPDVAELNLKKDLSEKVWQSEGSDGGNAGLKEPDGALHYDAAYVSWLDAQGRKRRRQRSSAQATGTKVSQLLRTLGKHLDSVEPEAFTISWTKDAVIVDYALGEGQKIREVLSAEKLRELTVGSRIRRERRR